MKSRVTYAKHRCIVNVFGSPGLLPSCPGWCVTAPLLHWHSSRCLRLSPLCMSASCRLWASVSSSPSFAFPICLNSPSAFSLWCAFLSRCSLTLTCLYARFISSVVARGYRTPGTRYRFHGSVSDMSAIRSCRGVRDCWLVGPHRLGLVPGLWLGGHVCCWPL